MATVLVTGFEPFGGDVINPSAQIAQALSGRRWQDDVVLGEILPCVFDRSRTRLRELIAQHQPSVVLCLGQAGGREGIQIERVAINVDDARIPDNEGVYRTDQTIVAGGPVAYWTTLPFRAISRELSLHGTPVFISQTAGTFVCNHVFYALMHELATFAHPVHAAGFVHVPWLPEQPGAQRGEPSMALAQQVAAIERAIKVCLREQPAA